MLVPLRYDTDGSGRLPNTSPEMLARFRAHLEALYPVTGAELTVHPPIGTTADVSREDGWTPAVEQVRRRAGKVDAA
jgi:hypothetical protein